MHIPLNNPADAVSMLESLADGVYATDTERRIVFWNRAAERITGYRADEVLGRSCSYNLLVHEDKDGHRLCGQEHCPLHRAIVTGRPSRMPMLVHAKCKNGTRIPTEVSVAPLRDVAGKVVGGIEVFREVTPVFDSLTRAALIQRGALACELPYDRCLQFSAQSTPTDYVGGDFYRVERLGSRAYALMVADVMGHGLAAALHTMQLRTLWEELRADLARPDAVLRGMHERLSILVQHDDYFATAVAAVVDVEARTVEYATAGHPPPFLRRYAHGQTIQLPSTGGLPLGVCAEGKHSPNVVAIGPGDVLLFCTDVVTEETDRQGRALGVDGFVAMLDELSFDGTAAALQRVEQGLLVYSDGLHLSDDLTLVAARICQTAPC